MPDDIIESPPSSDESPPEVITTSDAVLAAINEAIVEADPESPAALELKDKAKTPDPAAPKPNTPPETPEGTEAGKSAHSEGAADDETPDDSKAGGEEPASKAAAGDEPPKKDDAKKADEAANEFAHVTDPIPEEIKGRTRERMEKLIGEVRTLSERLELTGGAVDHFRQAIARTGADEKDWAEHMTLLEQMHSKDPKDRRAALATLQAHTRAIATELGEPVAGVDALEGHADLKEDVDLGRMTQEKAEELARARNRERALSERQAREQAAAAGPQARQQAEQQAIADLNALDLDLRRDPEYAYKRTVAMQSLEQIIADVEPAKWKSAFKRRYDAVTAEQIAALKAEETAAAAKANGGKKPNGAPERVSAEEAQQQPLRPKQPAGGSERQPSSLEEAIAAGIEESRHAR